MDSSELKSIFEASTSCSHTSCAIGEYYGNASNVNEELYFSFSQDIDNASNAIKHVDHEELPNS